VTALAYAIAPTPREIVIEKTASRIGSVEAAEYIVDELIKATLLHDESAVLSEQEIALLTMWRQWSARGWKRAFEYFISTMDAPFLESTVSGRAAAATRMEEYASIEPDNKRVRTALSFTVGSEPISLGDQVSIPVHERFHTPPLTFEYLSQFLSVAFCQQKSLPSEWEGLPITLRAAPSGGGRHPTDVYVLPMSCDRLPMAVYYLNYMDRQLVPINFPTRAEIEEAFSSLFSRLSFEPLVLLAFASNVERNMYRYREARTYRTIFLDAGHMLSIAEQMLVADGFKPYSHYYAAPTKFNRLINGSLDTDVFMAITAIGQ
jgi:SagB-type dehydrogenase family enzyme